MVVYLTKVMNMKKDKNKTGNYTFYEIGSQAESWKAVFTRIDTGSEVLKKLCKEPEDIIFTGCGSAFNIPNAVAPVFQKHSGKTCRAVHASELMIHPELFLNKNRKNLVIGYSRSGDTTESVNALVNSKKSGAETIAIVCFNESKMAKLSDTAIILEEAVEKSVTTTRSLTSMVLAGYYLAGIVSNNNNLCVDLRKLPEIAEEKMDQFHEMGKTISLDKHIKKYAFVGSGSYYGLAREAQLKFKEMVLLPSDSYVSLDFQHGPMSNVDKNMLVTILVSDSGMKYDLELAGNMKSLGGRVFTICDRHGEKFKNVSDYIIELGTGLGDGVRDILYMPALQYMAYYKSRSLGYDPDNPKNLSYHVELAQDS
jgi:glucosamine--fructose-6-phosphate aminotransferase (isomerizing)